MKRIDQKLAVSFEFPVIFTNHVFDPSNASLADAIDRLREGAVHRVIVFVDGNVTRDRPELIVLRADRYRIAYAAVDRDQTITVVDIVAHERTGGMPRVAAAT